MKTSFLVMVETSLSVDYLLPFFNEQILNDDVLKRLNMPDDFIISNRLEKLTQTKTLSFEKDSLGTVQLLTIVTADDFMNSSTKCLKGESPMYIKEIKQRKVRTKK